MALCGPDHLRHMANQNRTSSGRLDCKTPFEDAAGIQTPSRSTDRATAGEYARGKTTKESRRGRQREPAARSSTREIRPNCRACYHQSRKPHRSQPHSSKPAAGVEADHRRVGIRWIRAVKDANASHVPTRHHANDNELRGMPIPSNRDGVDAPTGWDLAKEMPPTTGEIAPLLKASAIAWHSTQKCSPKEYINQRK